MNFPVLFRAFDTVMAFRAAAKHFSASSRQPEHEQQTEPAATQGFVGQLENRLTSVIVAALKEAFDRDHARLELERAQLDEERRRAEAALRLEIRRQAVDREIARHRLLAGASMAGWIVSVVLVAAGAAGESTAARVALAVAWMLLLGALGAAFTAERRVSAASLDSDDALDVGAGAAAPWLLMVGLAATAVSLLV